MQEVQPQKGVKNRAALPDPGTARKPRGILEIPKGCTYHFDIAAGICRLLRDTASITGIAPLGRLQGTGLIISRRFAAENKQPSKNIIFAVIVAALEKNSEERRVSMHIVNQEELEELRKTYPNGTRVKLLRMDDFQAPPAGTEGVVYGVDGMGSLLVRWETGSHLSVLFGVDQVEKI